MSLRPARIRPWAALAGAFLALLLTGGARAAGRTLTTQDYARAERFMPYNTRPLVDHAVYRVHWLDNSRFWFIDHDARGDHYRVMNAATHAVTPAFNQIKLAAALSVATGKAVLAGKLSVSAFSTLADGRIDVTHAGKHYRCDLGGSPRCTPQPAAAGPGEAPGILSPNGKLEAFIRNWNLWVRNLASGKERQLTFDGVKNFGYATQNAGWIHSDRPDLNWSPDSTEIATYQQDQRQVGDMYLVSSRVGHPTLEEWKYALPGDQHVPMIQPVIIDVTTGKVVRLQLPPQQRLSSLCDELSCEGNGHWDDVQWAADGKTLAMVSTSRDRKHEWFRIVDARTGAVRTVFEESVRTYFNSGNSGVGAIDGVLAEDWRYLPTRHEAIWYSDRSDWGNLYLYDLKTGSLIRAITTGTGNVTQIVHLDRRSGTLWFRAVGRVPGVNPYYEQLWRVNLDGGGLKLLTPERCDHLISMSPDARYFVDSCSTPTRAPVATLRSARTGRILTTVARADLSRLRAVGWEPPQPIVVKARDGKTDLYGLLFKPTDFDPHKKYPIVDYIYPGPFLGTIFSFRFAPSRHDNQSLAELGFIVVAIDGMGTQYRSAAFRHLSYGDMGDNTLPDQVAAIRELAHRYPWMDIDRVGIWGHSGGGYATADALFRYPDFFKVGWAESGNHDNRDYEYAYSEMYQGLLVRHPDGTTNYDNQANELIASHLKGHLMLTYGTLDDNVPPENTLLVVEALIKANKNFDMIAIPNVRHSYGYATPYITRRRWDYFVRYLAGNIPPQHYALKAWPWPRQ